jgi:uncharacterized metal-binding protein
MTQRRPLLFACAGCSNAGTLAYDVAKELDRRGIAEMSCLAGVGAAKPHFLKMLHDRDVWVIDGCPIECGLGVFGQVSEHVDVHIRLHQFGVQKNAPLPVGAEFEEVINSALHQVAEQSVWAHDQACGNGPGQRGKSSVQTGDENAFASSPRRSDRRLGRRA